MKGNSRKEKELLSAIMMSSTDEYLSIIMEAASKYGMKVESHEIIGKSIVLMGRKGRREVVAICPIPSLHPTASEIRKTLNNGTKRGALKMLLAPFRVEGLEERQGKVSVRMGDELLADLASMPSVRSLVIERNAERKMKGNPLDDILWRAREAFDHGDNEEARKLARSALNVEPWNDEALRLMGHISQRAGDYDGALLYFRRAHETNPVNMDALFGMANAFFMLSRHDEELECYDAILKLDGRNRGALENKGVALQLMGRLDEAIRVYERFLKLHKYDDGVIKNLALACYNSGRKERALRLIDTLIEKNPENPSFIKLKGLMLSEENPAQAVEYLRKYVVMTGDTEVNSVLQYITLSNASANEIRIGEEAHAEKHEERHEDSARLIVQRLERNGMLNDAEAAARSTLLLQAIGGGEAERAAEYVVKEKIREEWRENTQLSLALEDFYFRRGDLQTALSIAERHLDRADFKERYLSSLLALGRRKEAADLLRSRMQHLPDRFRLYLLLACGEKEAANSLTGRRGIFWPLSADVAIASAARDEEKLPQKSTATDTPVLMNNLAVSEFIQGDAERASELLRASLRMGGHWSNLYNIAFLDIDRGALDEAERALEESLMKRETPLARNALGIVKSERRNYAEARKEFERSLQLDPDTKEAAKNLHSVRKYTD